MAYIGNTVQNQGFTPAIDYFNGNGVTVTFTLSRPIASVAQLIVAIDNVIQNPSTAFSVTGNSITFTSAPLSGTNNIWVEYTSLITTYAAISQDPSVIGDISATGGYLAEGDFGNTFIDGTIVDYVTGTARITTGPSDAITFYNNGTNARNTLLTLGATGQVAVNSSGSASAPVISKSDDLNTGIFFPAADTIAFSEGGAESMRIDSSGNVGIGTISPLGKLKVAIGDVAPAASGNMNTGVIYESFASSRAINFGVNNTAGYSWINAAFANNSGTADNLVLMTGATERMRINSAGIVTMPFQPSFVAGRSGDYTASDGAVAVWNTTSRNVGTCYNTSNGLFTAPVAGMYSFMTSIWTDVTMAQVWWVINGSRGVSVSLDGQTIMVGSATVYLNANDTFGFAPFTGVPTFTFFANPLHSYFAGTLIG
jgi:hypothetical protein